MTYTLFSLISICIGILAGNLTGLFYKKNALGLIGNTIAGVFGSIFFIKIIDRFNLGTSAIIIDETIQIKILLLNCIISATGGVTAVFLISNIKNRMNL